MRNKRARAGVLYSSVYIKIHQSSVSAERGGWEPEMAEVSSAQEPTHMENGGLGERAKEQIAIVDGCIASIVKRADRNSDK